MAKKISFAALIITAVVSALLFSQAGYAAPAPQKIAIEQGSVTLDMGKSRQYPLTAKITPADASQAVV